MTLEQQRVRLAATTARLTNISGLCAGIVACGAVPSLRAVLLRSEGEGELMLYSTDLFVSVETRVSASSTQPFKVAVAPQTLGHLVDRREPLKSVDLSLQHNGETIRLRDGDGAWQSNHALQDLSSLGPREDAKIPCPHAVYAKDLECALEKSLAFTAHRSLGTDGTPLPHIHVRVNLNGPKLCWASTDMRQAIRYAVPVLRRYENAVPPGVAEFPTLKVVPPKEGADLEGTSWSPALLQGMLVPRRCALALLTVLKVSSERKDWTDEKAPYVRWGYRNGVLVFELRLTHCMHRVYLRTRSTTGYPALEDAFSHESTRVVYLPCERLRDSVLRAWDFSEYGPELLLNFTRRRVYLRGVDRGKGYLQEQVTYTRPPQGDFPFEIRVSGTILATTLTHIGAGVCEMHIRHPHKGVELRNPVDPDLRVVFGLLL